MSSQLPRVVRFACHLARSGKFKNVGAIERELLAMGYGAEMQPLAIPTVREALENISARSRERPEEQQRQSTA